MQFFKRFLSVALAMSAAALYAVPQFVVKTDKPDAIYRCGEDIVISVQVMKDGKPLVGEMIKYELHADGGINKEGSYTTTSEPFVYKTKLDKPGALWMCFALADKNGKRIKAAKPVSQFRYVSGWVGAVAEPEKIEAYFKRPAGFEDFWAKKRQELDQVPLKVLEKKLILDEPQVRVWDIKVACSGPKPVSAYIAIPRNAKAKSCPAFVAYHGAGVGSCSMGQIIDKAKRGFIAMDVNAHGIVNGKPREFYQKLRNTEYRNYYSKIYEGLENHYFVYMVVRVMRSLDYIKSVPEWNGKELVVYGASQGGYQSLVAAGVDKNVTCCFAGVPGFGDFGGEFFSDPKRMPRIHFGGALRRSKKDMQYIRERLTEFSFLDAASFAPDIKCRTFVTVGFCDYSCPPTSVFSIYNAIPKSTDKVIKVYPGSVHSKAPADPKWINYINSLGKK